MVDIVIERAPRTAVVLIRAWIEECATVPVRVRVAWSAEGGDGTDVLVVASIDEACDVVRRRLIEFYKAAGSSGAASSVQGDAVTPP